MVEKASRGRRPAHLFAHRPPHARRHPVGGHGTELRGQPRHPRAEVRAGRGVGPDPERKRQHGDDHRRRHGEAAHRGARRPRDSLRPVVTHRHHFHRGAVLARCQRRLLPPPPQPGHDRRRGLVRVRQQRDHHGARREDRHAQRADGHLTRRDRRPRREPRIRQAGLGCDRKDCPHR